MKRILVILLTVLMIAGYSVEGFASNFTYDQVADMIDAVKVDGVKIFNNREEGSFSGDYEDFFTMRGAVLFWLDDRECGEFWFFKNGEKEMTRWEISSADSLEFAFDILGPILDDYIDYDIGGKMSFFVASSQSFNNPFLGVVEYSPKLKGAEDTLKNDDFDDFVSDVKMIVNVVTGKGEIPQTAPESAPASTQLQRGDKGDAVVALQNRLNELGYSVGKADGDFGGKTEKAIQQFQKINKAIYNELYDSKDGVADEKTQELLFSDKALYNLEALKGTSIVDRVSFFKGSNFKKLSTNVFDDYSYERIVDYDAYGNQKLPWLEKYEESEYSQLAIKNWYLEIESVAKHTVSVSVYDEKNCIVCDVFTDGSAAETAEFSAWIIDVLESIPELEKAAEKNGCGFSATIKGFTFKSDYPDNNGVVDLLDENTREGIISEYESAGAMLEVIAAFAALGN